MKEDEEHAAAHGISLIVPSNEHDNHERAVAQAIGAYGPIIAPTLPTISYKQLVMAAQVSKFSKASDVIAPGSAFIPTSHFEKYGSQIHAAAITNVWDDSAASN